MGILLDPKIRDNVLLPIFVVVVLTSMIRSSVMILFKNDPKVDVKEVKTQSMLGRCKMLRAASHFLTEKAFKCRKAYFVKKDVGVLVKSVPKAKDPMEALSAGSDPMAAMGMMKGQMVFMVSQGLLAYWVSHLFSGFLVAKTPFPLTFQFKAPACTSKSESETGFQTWMWHVTPIHRRVVTQQKVFDWCLSQFDPKSWFGSPLLSMPGHVTARRRCDSARAWLRFVFMLVYVAWFWILQWALFLFTCNFKVAVIQWFRPEAITALVSNAMFWSILQVCDDEQPQPHWIGAVLLHQIRCGSRGSDDGNEACAAWVELVWWPKNQTSLRFSDCSYVGCWGWEAWVEHPWCQVVGLILPRFTRRSRTGTGL